MFSGEDDFLPVLVPHLVIHDLLDGLEAVVGEEDLDNAGSDKKSRPTHKTKLTKTASTEWSMRSYSMF